jgi:hypothetical protein
MIQFLVGCSLAIIGGMTGSDKILAFAFPFSVIVGIGISVNLSLIFIFWIIARTKKCKNLHF